MRRNIPANVVWPNAGEFASPQMEIFCPADERYIVPMWGWTLPPVCSPATVSHCEHPAPLGCPCLPLASGPGRGVATLPPEEPAPDRGGTKINSIVQHLSQTSLSPRLWGLDSARHARHTLHMNPRDLSILDIELEPSPGSHFAPPLEAELVRELLPEDLLLLETTKLGSSAPTLSKIRGIHHHAARLLAAGMKDVEVSAVVGLCQSRISILKNDPAFQELLSFYAEQTMTAFAGVQDRMVSLGLDAAQELHERILSAPEEIPTKALVEIMTATLDRGGHSPVQKKETTVRVLSEKDIQAIKASAAEASVKPKPLTMKGVSSDGLPRSGETILGEIVAGETDVPTSEESAAREQGAGLGLREEGGESPEVDAAPGPVSGKPTLWAVD